MIARFSSNFFLCPLPGFSLGEGANLYFKEVKEFAIKQFHDKCFLLDFDLTDLKVIRETCALTRDRY